MSDELYKLVYAEHPCNDNYCDIGVANELGYPMVAAERLASACDWEIPNHLWDEETYEQQEAEFGLMWRLFTHECGSCDSYVYADKLLPRDLYCANCLHEVEATDMVARVNKATNYAYRAGRKYFDNLLGIIGRYAHDIAAAACFQAETETIETNMKLEESDELIVSIRDFVWHRAKDENFIAQLCTILDLPVGAVLI